MNKALSPAQEAELKFLRQQVDSCEQATYMLDRSADAQHKLRRAREELRSFTGNLRQQGYLI